MDALASVKPRQEVPDSGNVREDMLLWVEASVKSAHTSFERQMLSLLISTLSKNPSLAERYWLKYATPIYDILTEVLKRGQGRGEIRRDVNLNVLLDELSGTIFYQLSLKPASASLLNDFKRALDVVFYGIDMPRSNTPTSLWKCFNRRRFYRSISSLSGISFSLLQAGRTRNVLVGETAARGRGSHRTDRSACGAG